MRVVPAIPVASLLLGTVAGLWLWDVRAAQRAAYLLLACGTLTALVAHRRAHGLGLLMGVALTFGAGGALLAARTWRDAWRPSLRLAFEELAVGDGAVFGTLEGRLREDAALGGEGVRLSVDATRMRIQGHISGRSTEMVAAERARPVRGGVMVTVSGVLAPMAADRWRAGRTVRMPVRLKRPTRHLNPGALDGERALARRGTTLVGSVKSGALVEVVALGSRWAEACAAARAFVRRTVHAHTARMSPTAGAVVTAILIGDRAGLTATVERALQEAGTYHVIAISGGNIAILAAVTLAGFRWSGVLGGAAMVTAMGAFLLYGQLVTAGPSVRRAIIVAELYFAARAIDQRIAAGRSLLLAVGLLVAADPLAIVDPGFLLSVGATAGILAAAPVLDLWSPSSGARAVVGLLLASAAAEIALLPIVAFYFGRITVAGLVLNFAAVPLMTLVQIAGMVLMPVAVVSPAGADAVGLVAAIAALALVQSASLVEWLPVLAWRVSRPSGWVIAAYYGALVAGWAAWRLPALRSARPWRGRRRIATTAAAGAALWIAGEPWTWPSRWGDGRLHVTFLDVGQGDATLVRLPGGTAMLVDAGGQPGETYDVGDRVVAPALRWLGVRRLATLAVTHGDVDHAGGAATIAREFGPLEVWEGVPVPRSPVLQALQQSARSSGARWRRVQSRDRIEIDGVDVVVHHPVPPDWERQEPRNEDSIVLELRWKDVSIVLPGDIGRATEQLIAAQFEPVSLRVLKAPHHGSDSSSSGPFLDRLRPTVTVVSAGRGNPFGHPAPSVVGRNSARGAAVYRTDTDGAVTLETDGRALAVRTWSGRTVEYRATPADHTHRTNGSAHRDSTDGGQAMTTRRASP